MNFIIFLFYLILSTPGVDGTKIGSQYDVGALRSGFNDILGGALLNEAGSKIIEAGRAKIAEMESTSCTRKVLFKLTTECDRITERAEKTIALEYLTCVTDSDDIKLPQECTREQSWLSMVWTTQETCVQALEKRTSLWTTFSGFRQNINSMCVAHTFDKKLHAIQTGTVDLIEAGQNLSTGITELVRRVYQFEERVTPYLQSIENGVQNTLASLSQLISIVTEMYNMTEQISNRVDVIMINLDDVNGMVGDLSHNVSYLGSEIKNNSVTLHVMSIELKDFKGEFQEFFDILKVCRPFFTLIKEAFMFLRKPLYIFLLSGAAWVWWYYVHGPPAKLVFITVPYALYQISLDVVTHIPPYILAVGCIAFLFLFAIIYRELCFFYTRGRIKEAERVLEQYCEEYRKGVCI